MPPLGNRLESLYEEIKGRGPLICLISEPFRHIPNMLLGIPPSEEVGRGLGESRG
jgi:hypothetical protein